MMTYPCHAKKKQNSCKPSIVLIFTMITATVIQTAITGIQAGETITTETTINLTDDKPDLQKQLSYFIKAQHSTNSFVKDTFMDLKNKLETTTKNLQASIQNLQDKFDRLADKQSGRPFRSLPSNTQPNPKGSSSKPYHPLQTRNEHVNAVFTRSGKSYDPPVKPNDQQNNSEIPINFDSVDEDDEPTPQPKPKTPKPVKETSTPNHTNQKSYILNASEKKK
ncbi:hypothetical protein Tco_1201580 [Tanacetum coccineum]